MRPTRDAHFILGALSSLSLGALVLTALPGAANAEWEDVTWLPSPPPLDEPAYVPDSMPLPDFGPPPLGLYERSRQPAHVGCPDDLRTPPLARVPDPEGGGPYVIALPVLEATCESNAETWVEGGFMGASASTLDRFHVPGPGGGHATFGAIAWARTVVGDAGVRIDLEVLVQGHSTFTLHKDDAQHLGDHKNWEFFAPGSVHLGIPFPEDYAGSVTLRWGSAVKGELVWDVDRRGARASVSARAQLTAEVTAHVVEDADCLFGLICWGGEQWLHGDWIEVLDRESAARAHVGFERRPEGWTVCGRAHAHQWLQALRGSGNGVYVPLGEAVEPADEDDQPMCTRAVDPFWFMS